MLSLHPSSSLLKEAVFNMKKIYKGFPHPSDCTSDNDDEFEDNIPFDVDDELEELYIPNLRKETKRNQAAKDSQKNKWRIKD